MIPTARVLFALLAAGSLVVAQEPPAPAPAPAQSVVLDGTPLEDPSAILDPAGTLEIRGGDLAWRVRFPRLDFPTPNAYGFERVGRDNTVFAMVRNDDLWDRVTGQLNVNKWTAEHVDGVLQLPGEDGTTLVEFAVNPELRRIKRPRVVDARDVSGFAMPRDEPVKRDLVFCAVGNTGTGLPGATKVAEQIATLAETGPLDFVLLAGDVFAPNGVSSATDPQWQTKFERLFDPARLGCAFYAALGDCEHKNGLAPFTAYGASSFRWTMPALTYTFEVKSHGKRFLFASLDTTSIMGDISEAITRFSMRRPFFELEDSDADWKIAFGHEPVYSTNTPQNTKGARRMRQIVMQSLMVTGTDLYISGGANVTEIIGPRVGVVHVGVGGGGGPELDGPVRWGDDTMTAFQGGGFAWFRFDGEKLEVSLRDIDGKVRYVHTVHK